MKGYKISAKVDYSEAKEIETPNFEGGRGVAIEFVRKLLDENRDAEKFVITIYPK